MRITLLTEGTYPTSHGGVSVWCDQLVGGLDEHEFSLVAVTGNENDQAVWDLPRNVVDVALLPMWGATKRGRLDRGLRRDFERSWELFVEAMFGPCSRPIDAFLQALRGFHLVARQVGLRRAFMTDDTFASLVQAWRSHPLGIRPNGASLPTPSLSDMLSSLDLIEHFLRPLGAQPGPSHVCHAVSNGLAVLPAFVAKWEHGTPFLLTEHGIYLRERYIAYARNNDYSPAMKAFILRFYFLVTSAAYEMADMVTPGSEYNTRWELLNGAAPDVIRPVYNGVDPSNFPLAADEPEVPTISWVGRVDPLKDVETLIRAFSMVKKEVPDARLRMFGAVPTGGEWYYERCEALIDELNLTGVAVFEGRVPDIVDAYHSGHVVALTSTSEGFPYTIIEAMTVGRPCVGTDVGGVREAISETGYVVPPRKPEAVAQACIRLLKDDDLRNKMGEAARRRALEHFTLDGFLDAYREIYTEVADAAVLQQQDWHAIESAVTPLFVFEDALL